MIAITPTSEKYTILPSSSLRRGCRSLKFRWTFGEQRLRPERPAASIVALDDNGDAGAENIGDDARIGDRQRLRPLRDDEGDGLLRVVAHNRARLHYPGHAHILRHAGLAAFQF